MSKHHYRTQLVKVVTVLAMVAAVVPWNSTAHAMDAEPDLVFVTSVGGVGDDRGFSVAVDDAGNTYVTGRFSGTADFDGNPTTTGDQHASNGSQDIFVASYDPAGALRWVTATGGTGTSNEVATSVAVDAAGNTYITGYFQDTADFDGNPATTGDQHTSNGSQDIFVASYDPAGALRWVTATGGTGPDRARSVVVDAAGNTYITGSFGGSFGGTSDFDGDLATTGDQRTSNGLDDTFVASYDPTGAYRWVTTSGGTSNDTGRSVGVDAAGNTYITGSFEGTVDFDGIPVTLADKRTSNGSSDIFVVSYGADGTYRWVFTAGDTSKDEGLSVAVDAAGNTYVIGYFEGTADFDGNPTTAADQRTSNGNGRTVFVASYGPDGNYRWVTTADPGFVTGLSVGVDAAGNTYITGNFAGTADFDGNPTTVADQRTSNGGIDIFAASYDPTGALRWFTTAGGTSNDLALSGAVDATGNTYLTGYFVGTGDFDGDPATTGDQRTSKGSSDIFVMRLAVVDIDGDGFQGANGDGTDCDDSDPGVNPDATEIAYNAVDENCDGADLDDVDGDGSPSTAATGGTPDCDDTDPAINPDAVEIAGDGIDQDCDGVDATAQLCRGLAVTIDMNTGANGFGTAGDDVIFGTPGPDVIDGMDGDDTICGNGGDDNISGSGGLDFILGGDGNDTMTGGDGNDRIRGQQGIDTINGGPGNDFLYGGVEGDTITGGDGNDVIGGFGGADIINAGPGNDTIFGGFGPDTINAGDGDDTVAGLIGNDTINGDAGDDMLNGDTGQDTINGGPGNDTINGGNSLDTLNGNDGDDNLNGGKADDILSGGPGNDTCTGNKHAITDTADTTCETTFGIP